MSSPTYAFYPFSCKKELRHNRESKLKIENRYIGEMSSFEREYSTENCNLIKNKANRKQ